MAHGVDLEMSGLLWMADGRIASFDFRFASPYRSWLELSRTDAVLPVTGMWLPQPEAPFVMQRENAAPEVVTVPGYHQIALMTDDFSRAVLEGCEVRPAADEAGKPPRALDALAKSARGSA